MFTKKYIRGFIVLLLALFLVIPAEMVQAVTDALSTSIKHKPVRSYLPGFRIPLDAEIKDDSGVRISRCYFRAKEEKDFLFVDMEKADRYTAMLPAPEVGSESIYYYFLVVNGKNQVVKSQVFEMKEKETEEVAKWNEAKDTGKSNTELRKLRRKLTRQIRERFKDKIDKTRRVNKDSKLQVKSEATDAPTEISGFSDNVAINTVSSGARYGMMTASTVTATAGGLSTATMLGGLAVVAAGGAAVAAGGGGSDTNEGPSGSEPGTTVPFHGTISGSWSGNCEGLGSVGGSFNMTVSTDGRVEGSYWGDDEGNISGRVNAAGDFRTAGGTTSSGTTWTGTIRQDSEGLLSGSGEWSDNDPEYPCTGSWESG
jgi:gas vesicle protein